MFETRKLTPADRLSLFCQNYTKLNGYMKLTWETSRELPGPTSNEIPVHVLRGGRQFESDGMSNIDFGRSSTDEN